MLDHTELDIDITMQGIEALLNSLRAQLYLAIRDELIEHSNRKINAGKQLSFICGMGTWYFCKDDNSTKQFKTKMDKVIQKALDFQGWAALPGVFIHVKDGRVIDEEAVF